MPIIQKGAFVNGSIDFSKKDFNELVRQEKPTFLLTLTEKEEVTDKLNEYFEIGITKGIDKRYKCSLRKKWYSVPNISIPPEGFFFKRSHLYPKLIKNSANVHATDAAYKVSMKDGYKIEELICSFYNYVSLIFAELYGRRYGGGVLELTPNEFREIPIAYNNINQSDYHAFRNKFEKKTSIEKILTANQEILAKYIDNTDFSMLKRIYKKLINDRLLQGCNKKLSKNKMP